MQLQGYCLAFTEGVPFPNTRTRVTNGIVVSTMIQERFMLLLQNKIDHYVSPTGAPPLIKLFAIYRK
jgi:hypothetical protein